MAFLLYPPGSRELDLLQTAVLNVGQHSTRFGGERPSKSARSGLSGLRLSARRLAGALSARRLAGALSAQFGPKGPRFSAFRLLPLRLRPAAHDEASLREVGFYARGEAKRRLG